MKEVGRQALPKYFLSINTSCLTFRFHGGRRGGPWRFTPIAHGTDERRNAKALLKACLHWSMASVGCLRVKSGGWPDVPI